MNESPSLTNPTRIPDGLRSAVDQALATALADGWVRRIWDRDVTVWARDAAVGEKVANRLGWLDAPEAFLDRSVELQAFAAGARAEGFTDAIVCGMGGSSLAPDVLARSFQLGEGGVAVHILDSTDPAAVLAAHEAYDPATTLYLIASKSGTTTESLSFLAYFWDVEEHLHHAIPASETGEHFVAITDPGKSVEAIPHTDAFRSVFLNPADVGGRYSALTYVGMVPAALMGIDLDALLGDAARMAERCRDETAANPGLELGVTLGALARQGRDKLTLVTDPSIETFGAWAEQLVAESTGKHGVGIIPIDREPLGDPVAYPTPDRVFVRLGPATSTEWRASTDPQLDALAAAGHPVIDITTAADGGLGGEFFRWEFATAVAGAVLGIDPFDEPNVTESKDNTRRVLAAFRDNGTFPDETALASEGPLTLYGDAALRLTAGHDDVRAEIKRHLARARPAGYVALQAYLAPSPERDAALTGLRRLIRDRTGHATTAGYGPRFLHSTGQLHKGGAPIGCFIQLVAGHPRDVEIPGERETFGNLIDAQSLGDLASLESHDLPVIRIHLSDDADAGLAALRSALEATL